MSWKYNAGVFVLAAAIIAPGLAHSAELKILTAGAFKAVVVALVPDFEKRTGHKVIVDNDTPGPLRRASRRARSSMSP